MPRINFVFAIHFHQPTGQLKWINDRVYENSYKLLLDIFKKYADLKFTIHISGPLLLYMLDYYPEWVDEIAKLGDYGTFEFLAGSLGESILPLLPYSDRVEQVREYLRLFEKTFGFKPRGLWLPERVWEPGLPEPLAKNGIEYVLIDDSTLYRAGKSEPDNYYVWLTEEGGYRVKVFFIDTGLRYILPWRSSGEVIDYMTSKAGDTGDRVIVWGSDAEKFGEWKDPEWARNWLEDFLSRMRRERDRVLMIHPTEYIREYGVKGLIYLPSGSYDKMLEWSGGFFRNFLIKYRESNNMHKKMLWVRRKLVEMPYRDEEAWRHYYLAQCNDPYWHGLFGGIYLSHLRQAVYENYIIAERIAEENTCYYTVDTILHKTDFDYDGRDEVIIEKPTLNLYIKPDDGGTVFEFDIKRKGYEHNIQDTMTRYMESYLENIGFNPDWYRRVSLRLHMWSLDTNLNDWINNTPFKDQSDLALKKHYVIITPEKQVILRTTGYYYGVNPPVPVYVEKKIRVGENGYTTHYMIQNRGDNIISTLLGIEYHVAPKINRVDPNAELGYETSEYHSVDEKWADRGDSIVIKSTGYPDIMLIANRETSIWVSPLYSKARTEKGLQDIFQGIAVMFVEKITLKPGEAFELTVKHYVKL